jgi:general secretion pathway protein G
LINKKDKTIKAFTLVELLAVIAIIGILLSLSYVYFNGMMQKSRDTKRVTEISQIQNALQLYYRDEGQYPDSLNFGGSLVGSTSSTTYMAIVPQNPTPRDDGNCSDNEFIYATSTNANGKRDYSLKFCLSEATSNLSPGCNAASSLGIENAAPLCLNNLEVWLDANRGVTLNGSAVSTWADRSGNNNNATQSTPASQPLYVANALNNQAGISFDGSSDWLLLPFNNSFSDDFTVYIVWYDSGVYSDSYAQIFQDTTGPGLHNFGGTVYIADGVSGVGYSKAPPYTIITSGIYAQANSRIYENGILENSGTLSSMTISQLDIA